MTIGGVDILLKAITPKHGTLQERVIRFFVSRWPDCVVETDDLPSAIGAVSAISHPDVLAADELFIYPSQDDAASWAEHGATPENANRMVHLIFSLMSDVSSERSVTAVIGEMNAETERLIDGLKIVLKQD